MKQIIIGLLIMAVAVAGCITVSAAYADGCSCAPCQCGKCSC